MLCNKCGAEIKVEERFCGQCGNQVESTVDQQQENTADQQQGLTKLSTFSGLSWLVLAIFVLQGTFLFKSILLIIYQKSLPFMVTPVISILNYTLFILLLMAYMNRISIDKTSVSLKTYFRALISGMSSFIFIIGAFTMSGLIYSRAYPLVISAGMDNSVFGISLLAGYILLTFILQYFLIAGIFLLYVTVKYSFNFFQTGKALGRVLAGMLKRLPAMLFLDVIFTGMFVIFYFIQNYGGNLIVYLQPYGFLQVFLKYLLASSLYAVMLSILFSKFRKIDEKETEKFLNIAENKTFALPLVPIILAAISIIALLILPLQPVNGYSSIITEIKGHDTRGDILKDAGYSIGAIKEYDTALSKLFSLQAYLMERKAVLSQNAALKNDGVKLMGAARSLDNLNGYISLFDGKLAIEEKQAESGIAILSTGVKNPLAMPEAYINLLEASKHTAKEPDKAMQKLALEWLLGHEIYHDKFKDIEKISLKKIDNCMDELEDLKKQIEPKQAYKYFEKTNLNRHSEALSGILPLKEKYPDNVEINYMLTRIYAEYRNEQAHYAKLLDAAKGFSASVKNSGDPELLLQKESYTARMYMQADDYSKAESIFAGLYKEHSGSRETAEAYLYLLVRNKKADEALKLAEKLEKEGNSPSLIYQYALALLNKGQYSESLQKIKGLEKFSEPYTEEYDRYLYAYSLAYVNAMKGKEQIDILDKGLGDYLLKNYILALRGWRDQNYASSQLELDKVLARDSRLGYAWYCKGINAYEKAVRTNSGNYNEAIQNYLKSLKILPDHVEGYFAIAHCYKKAEMKEEALRAFRKVLDLVPYEDHRVDPYGMVVHAVGEVSSLESELKAKGGK